MAKQIKIGLDKVPAPVTKQFTQLVDIEGTKLFDAAGNPLVTEEEVSLLKFTSSENALSVYVNNDEIRTIPIEEQFPDTSDVSSSILGVPRSEEQQSLFSDVATYGLDEEQWNQYTFANQQSPSQWYRKKHPIYGRRSNPTFNEGSTEQALYLKTFPSQYNFPRGTVESRRTSPTDGFRAYMNFIGLGKYLYTIFKSSDPDFAERFLINDDIAYVVDQSGEQVEYKLLLNGSKAVFDKNGNWHDVEYGGDDIQIAFDAIENWTFLFEQIKDGIAKFPPLLGSAETDYTRSSGYSKLVSFARSTDCVPGGSSLNNQVAVLESKRAFRYQPGRASGFTFGARLASSPNSIDTTLEWGCSNDTDEYMFQLKGSQFNIVRRSTIRMPDELLLRQGLSIEDQSDTAIYVDGIGNSEALWETTILRSKWNGDALLGIGESGYILSFEDVTMYKIEFSWYGAIGARFYAYIPVGNGDARWVKLHTFIIENGLGQPVLANPDFKFKYILSSGDNANIRAPVYLYKYGSSYYIDGGDEGTIRLSTTTANSKAFTSRTPILGVLPKNHILNSKGAAVRNYKKAYPVNISINSDKLCRIDVEEIVGSPQGVHFNFSPSIHMNGRHPKSRSLDFGYTSDSLIDILQPTDATVQGTINVEASSKNVIGVSTAFTTDLVIGDNISIAGVEYQVALIDDDNTLTLATEYIASTATGLTVTVVKRLNSDDQYGHIIADGVYGVYVNPSYQANGRSTNTLRRNSSYNLTEQSVRRSLNVNGSILDPSNSATFSGVLTNYNTIVASETPINANKFKIHFLNPQGRDGSYLSKHWAEFTVSVTPYKPIAPGGDADENKLQFDNSFIEGAPDYKDYDINAHPFVEYCHVSTNYSQISRAEFEEWDPTYGDQMEIDPRLTNPAGADSGDISTVVGSVSLIDYQVIGVEQGTGEFSAFVKITFASGVSGPTNNTIKFDANGAGLSEVGIGFVGTGEFFATTITQPTDSNAYVYVTDNNSGALETAIDALISNGQAFIQTKILELSHDWQAISYDKNGQERFTDNKFIKSQVIPFNAQPLYPVFALQDFAKINGIVIEEIGEDGLIRTHTPSLITEADTYNTNISIVNSGGSNKTETPCAFNSDEQLASCRYDSTALNPLRSGSNLYSFYVDANKPTLMDLTSIFNVDRKGVSRGLLNNKAIYFTATSLDGSQGNVEATLTVREQ